MRSQLPTNEKTFKDDGILDPFANPQFFNDIFGFCSKTIIHFTVVQYFIFNQQFNFKNIKFGQQWDSNVLK